MTAATAGREHLPLCPGWRLSEDGVSQWMLQRENPEAGDEENRWRSRAFCGTREGLLAVALPRHRVQPTSAALQTLRRLPDHYEAGALFDLVAGIETENQPPKGDRG